MNHEDFNDVFEHQVKASRRVLASKAEEYDGGASDRFHNFKIAAAFNGVTPEQALWGMLTKHLVSLRDMVQDDKTYSLDQWSEKLGDAINYLFLLKGLVVEEELCNGVIDFDSKPTRGTGPTVVNVFANEKTQEN